MDQSWFLYCVLSVCDVLVVVGFKNLKHVLAFVVFFGLLSCFFSSFPIYSYTPQLVFFDFGN